MNENEFVRMREERDKLRREVERLSYANAEFSAHNVKLRRTIKFLSDEVEWWRGEAKKKQEVLADTLEAKSCVAVGVYGFNTEEKFRCASEVREDEKSDFSRESKCSTMDENEFRHAGKTYVAVEDLDFEICSNCIFKTNFGCTTLMDRGEIPSCGAQNRKDGRDVIFVEKGVQYNERK